MILMLVLMVATAVALVTGIIMMARGGAANQKYGNKMMTLRVILQASVLLVLGAMFLVGGK
jgi:hypothetical protein